MAHPLPWKPPVWWYHDNHAELRRQATDPTTENSITAAMFDAEYQRYLEIAQREYPRQRYYQQWYAEAGTFFTFWGRPFPNGCPLMIEDKFRAIDDAMEAEEARLALLTPGTRLFTRTASGSLKLTRDIEQEEGKVVVDTASESAAVSSGTNKGKGKGKVVVDSGLESAAGSSGTNKGKGKAKVASDSEAEYDAIPNLKKETTPAEERMVSDFEAISAAVPTNTKEAQTANGTVKKESIVEPPVVPTPKKTVSIKMDNREGGYSYQDDHRSRNDHPSRYEGSFSRQDDYRSRDDSYSGAFDRSERFGGNRDSGPLMEELLDAVRKIDAADRGFQYGNSLCRREPPLPPIRERRQSPDGGRSGPNYHPGNRNQSCNWESQRPPALERRRRSRSRDRRSQSPAPSEEPPVSGDQPQTGQGQKGKGKRKRNRGGGRKRWNRRRSRT